MNNYVQRSKEIKDELANVKFRYKKPTEHKSRLIQHIVDYDVKDGSNNLQFASAVAEFGMLIRASEHRGNASFNQLISRAQLSKGEDSHGYRKDFIEIVQRSKILMEEYTTNLSSQK